MKKHLLSLLCLLTFALPGLADTWTSTRTVAADWDKILSPSSSTNTIAPTSWTDTSNGLEGTWSMEYTWQTSGKVYYARSKNGIQMGSGSAGLKEMFLSSNSFTGQITKVTVHGAKSNGYANLSVKVGETEFTINGNTSATLNSTANDQVFSGSASGEIEISFTGNGDGKYIGLSGLTVEYSNISTPTTCTPPIFNIAHNSKVPVGTVVHATCDTPNSTVTIYGPGVEAPVVGEDKAGYAEFTLTEDKLNTEVVLTATATVEGENGPITSDPTNIQFSVVEAPKTVTDEITSTTLGLKGTGYAVYAQTSTATKVEYKAKSHYEKESIHINTGSSSSGKDSGLASVNNPDNLIIDSIIITIADGTPVLKMSNEAGSVAGSGTNAAVSAPTDAETITGTKSGNDIVYTPTKDFKYFTLTSDGNSHFSKVLVNYRKPDAPETTDVTLAWGEMAKEFTVGETGVTGELTVEPAEALPFVNVTSSNAEVATAKFDAETGLVELNFLKASAEPVVITATIDDPNGKFVTKENATFSFTVKEAEVVLEPEAIVVTPALDEDGYILVTTGTKITFSSNNAAKLSVSIYGAEATLEANPFIFTATEETTIEIIPIDSEGKRYEVLKLKASIYIEEVIEPEKATTTYTFDFTKNDHVHPVYGEYNTDEYVYLASDGAGIFEPYFCTETGYDSKHSYVDEKGWKLSSADTGISSYMYLYFAQDLEHNYKIKSVKFNYTADGKVDILAGSNPEQTEELTDNLWTGSDDSPVFNFVSIYDFTINSIDVTFEHEVVKLPKLIGGTMEMGLALTHENDDHAVFFKITDAYGNDVTADRMLTGTVASAPARAISIDTDHEGHTPYTAGSEFTMKPADKLSTYAQHPHGMVSKVYSTTYEDIATGIGSIEADSETEAVYFNLQGVRVAEPTESVYIRVANGKATKVIK